MAALRKQFLQILAKEEGTRLGEDPEELHAMRVACRRLRTAISLFENHLPAFTQELRLETGWLADVLGKVRDADVQLEKLSEWRDALPKDLAEALEPLRPQIVESREAGRRELLVALDSERFSSYKATYAAALVSAEEPESPPALSEAPVIVQKRMAKLRKQVKSLSKDSPDEEFHRARILAKRLRYAVEFVAPLYGPEAKAASSKVVLLQDLLGGLQDDVVGQAWVRKASSSSDCRTAFALGVHYQNMAHDAAGRKAALKKTFREVDGLEWEVLLETMQSAMS